MCSLSYFSGSEGHGGDLSKWCIFFFGRGSGTEQVLEGFKSFEGLSFDLLIAS